MTAIWKEKSFSVCATFLKPRRLSIKRLNYVIMKKLTLILSLWFVLLLAGCSSDDAPTAVTPVLLPPMTWKTVSAGEEHTAAIRSELDLGQAQWLFFETAMRRSPDAQGMAAVATTSERLLEVTDRLTSLYDAALREVLG